MVLAAALDFSWEEGALEWSLAVRSRFVCALAPLPILLRISLVGRSLSDVFLDLNADMQAVRYGFEGLVAAGGERGQRCGREKYMSGLRTDCLPSRLSPSVLALSHPPSPLAHGLQLAIRRSMYHRHLTTDITGILVNLDLHSEIFAFGVSLRLLRQKLLHCRAPLLHKNLQTLLYDEKGGIVLQRSLRMDELEIVPSN
jgi:hypothetical protein